MNKYLDGTIVPHPTGQLSIALIVHFGYDELVRVKSIFLLFNQGNNQCSGKLRKCFLPQPLSKGGHHDQRCGSRRDYRLPDHAPVEWKEKEVSL